MFLVMALNFGSDLWYFVFRNDLRKITLILNRSIGLVVVDVENMKRFEEAVGVLKSSF